ncbi:RNA polymerase sigma factor [Roseimaritima ulvae]|uniref:RNA polymerase sigma factor CnrH n=1 Tax=Roseimaritima ulvae TaxID=980254 RepID=A0A5B9QK13_9BACT|nr:sigma-70 family RNA polymerase sigma factor [Roseimaritima ulvae]QEG38319.1 RNA polymerase sigma factor CnrH [Roseimaritima ulvae]
MTAEHPTVSSMWLTGVQKMDADSWSRLVNTFGPIVYRWCRASGVSEADAADVVQEVFTAVARAVPQFQRDKPQGSFRAWLATITRNKVRDYFRRGRDRQAAVGGTEPLLQMQQLPDDLDSTITSENILSPLAHRILRQVRAEFEPHTWQAFWLTAVEERAAADVAQTLEISVASVYQAKSRVLRRLRQRMEEF